jgi:hypothetical protein
MADHTDNALRAAIKALEEVVRPAVNPDDPLATEQLRMVAELLGFLGQRLDQLYDRQRFELGHALQLAVDVAPDVAACAPSATPELRTAIDEGRTVFAAAGTGSATLKAASGRLASAVSGAVRIAPIAGVDADAQRRLERKVVAAAKAFMDAQRSWFLPGGFEPDASQVPPLERALRLDARSEAAASV